MVIIVIIAPFVILPNSEDGVTVETLSRRDDGLLWLGCGQWRDIAVTVATGAAGLLADPRIICTIAFLLVERVA
jgi:hypothetical protein